jgi:hypothetical protein
MADTEISSPPVVVIVTDPSAPRSYDQKKYNRKFCETHSEKIHAKTECEICGGSFTYFNKSKHLKTQRHLKMIARAAPKGCSA